MHNIGGLWPSIVKFPMHACTNTIVPGLLSHVLRENAVKSCAFAPQKRRPNESIMVQNIAHNMVNVITCGH